jgi:hypothetical protein
MTQSEVAKPVTVTNGLVYAGCEAIVRIVRVVVMGGHRGGDRGGGIVDGGCQQTGEAVNSVLKVGFGQPKGTSLLAINSSAAWYQQGLFPQRHP